jgi:hypothetical protein
MHWEVLAGAAEASNEVVFKGLDCSFSCVAPVEVRRNKLEVDRLCLHEAFETSGGFVVQFLENRLQAALDEGQVNNRVGSE